MRYIKHFGFFFTHVFVLPLARGKVHEDMMMKIRYTPRPPNQSFCNVYAKREFAIAGPTARAVRQWFVQRRSHSRVFVDYLQKMSCT